MLSREGDEREREESILGDDAVVEVVNGINNGADDNDGVLLCKRGQSRRALHQWQVHKGVSILRETRSLERDLCPDFPFRLEVQLIVDKAVTVQSMKKDSALV